MSINFNAKAVIDRILELQSNSFYYLIFPMAITTALCNYVGVSIISNLMVTGIFIPCVVLSIREYFFRESGNFHDDLLDRSAVITALAIAIFVEPSIRAFSFPINLVLWAVPRTLLLMTALSVPLESVSGDYILDGGLPPPHYKPTDQDLRGVYSNNIKE